MRTRVRTRGLGSREISRYTGGVDRARVVIVGGGFGGLVAARTLRGAPVDVTLIDRRNHHLFQPLLYQVATGGLSPANIAAPLRRVFSRQRNCTVMLADVVGFDVEQRRVRLGPPPGLPDQPVPIDVAYDWLIVAAGARHNYFGNAAWESLAPGLKSLEDATAIRSRILAAFEAAEAAVLGGASAQEAARQWLTFVIVGAGPTGVELAGTLAEIARDTLRHDFRAIDPAAARIVLVDAADRVLPAYVPELSNRARRSLERLGVEVCTGALVANIEPGRVVVRVDGREEALAARLVLWSAGVQASPLGRLLVESGHDGARLEERLDRAGRVRVASDLTLPGRPEIFVIGDLAALTGADGRPLPGVAPVAMQQGRHAARQIAARLAGKTTRPFRYVDKGSMATIGRAAAVADFGRVRMWGYPAWLAWLFVHLAFLIEFQNRVLVLLQWAWNYATWQRSARLITEQGVRAEAGSKPARKRRAGPEARA